MVFVVRKGGLPVLARVGWGVGAMGAGRSYMGGVGWRACTFCAYGVRKRLNKVKGVTGVGVGIGKSAERVAIQEGKPFSEERARQAVEEAGFTLRSYSEAEGETGGSDAK